MTWRIIPEGSSRTISLEAGEIDVIIEVETNDLARMEENEEIAVYNIPGTSFNWLILNNEVAPFDNQDFRHFMNCAIQKDALVEVALNGAGTGNYRQSPGMFAGATDRNIDKYDPELAKEYLEKSGVDPTTVVFSCICSDDVKRRCGEVMQATLAEYGVTMNLESMDLATYLSAAGEGNFEACIGNCTTSNSLGFIEYKYHSKMIGGSNWTRTNDPKIDALYDEAVQTLDETKRMELVEECIAYIQEICPQVPTYSMNMVRAMDADLEGFEMNASGNTYWHYVSWAE
jgi:peptide/nickel transport system substrate-binding protein